MYIMYAYMQVPTFAKLTDSDWNYVILWIAYSLHSNK